MSRCIITLGMHRSGTSALTGTLQQLGVHLGSDLMPPAASNAKGHFEHLQVYETHERLLRQLGSSWDDIRPLPEGWLASPAALNAREDLISLLKRDLCGSGLWAVKDPRICRLLPLWQQVLEAISCTPSYLIAWREPEEVALSLKSRNGFHPEKSVFLWAVHLLDTLRMIGSQPHYIVRYEQLLQHPAATLEKIGRKLNIEWPRSLEKTLPQLQDFLDPTLRHSASQNADVEFHRAERFAKLIPQLISEPNEREQKIEELYLSYLEVVNEVARSDNLTRAKDVQEMSEQSCRKNSRLVFHRLTRELTRLFDQFKNAGRCVERRFRRWRLRLRPQNYQCQDR